MRDMLSIAIAIAVISGTSTDKASACNLRLPAFEVAGFEFTVWLPRYWVARETT